MYLDSVWLRPPASVICGCKLNRERQEPELPIFDLKGLVSDAFCAQICAFKPLRNVCLCLICALSVVDASLISISNVISGCNSVCRMESGILDGN